MCESKNAMAYVKTQLKERGYITNFECIDQKITTRLGALICELRKNGWLIDGDFIPGTKNFKYTLQGFCEIDIKDKKRKKTYKELEKENLELSLELNNSKMEVADLTIAIRLLEKRLREIEKKV